MKFLSFTKKNCFLFALLLIFTLSVSFIAGCSKTNKAEQISEPVSLTLWHYYNDSQKKEMDDLITEFNNTVGADKKITIEAVSQGAVDILLKNVMAAANEEVGTEKIPDIFASYTDTAYELDQKGLLADFSQYMTKDELTEYVDSFMEEGHFNDKSGYKLFPIAKSTEVLVLNKTDWDKFANATGASEKDLATWEGVTELSKKYYDWTDSLTDKPNDGKSFIGIDAIANYVLVEGKQLGLDIFNVKNGEVTFDTNEEVMKKLWDNYYIPYINGYNNAIGRFRSDDMRTGDLIANIASTAASHYYSSEVTLDDGSTYPIELKAYPMPVFEDGEKVAVQQGAGMAISKNSEDKEKAATIFLKWFTEKERNTKFAINTGYLPVKKDALSHDNIENAIKEINSSNNKDNHVPKIVKDIVYTGVDTANDYTLYNAEGFNNAFKARNFVDDKFKNTAKNDRIKVKEQLDNGKSLAEATSNFITDEYFQTWLESFREGLEVFK